MATTTKKTRYWFGVVQRTYGKTSMKTKKTGYAHVGPQAIKRKLEREYGLQLEYMGRSACFGDSSRRLSDSQTCSYYRDKTSHAKPVMFVLYMYEV
mgnify:CR=1 FL=1